MHIQQIIKLCSWLKEAYQLIYCDKGKLFPSWSPTRE